jgi:hypothetical protein
MLKALDWLELHPETTWQERWDASGAEADGTADWRVQMLDELEAAGRLGPRGGELHHGLSTGLLQLISGDVIRPGLPWLLATTSPSRVAGEMGRTRDPAGIAALRALREACTVGKSTFDPAVEPVALIMAAKGGLVADITPGDCVGCWTAAGSCSRTTALQACAAGIYAVEAGVALLAGNGTFLRRHNSTSRFIEHGTSDGTPWPPSTGTPRPPH